MTTRFCIVAASLLAAFLITIHADETNPDGTKTRQENVWVLETATQVLPARSARTFAYIRNTSTNTVYFSLGTNATVAGSMPLKADDVYEVTACDPWTGPVTFIGAAGTVSNAVRVVEVYTDK
jgi:hypothetical protein